MKTEIKIKHCKKNFYKVSSNKLKRRLTPKYDIDYIWSMIFSIIMYDLILLNHTKKGTQTYKRF